MTEKVVYQLKSCPDHDKFAADIAYLRGAVTVGFTGKGVFPLAPGASITLRGNNVTLPAISYPAASTTGITVVYVMKVKSGYYWSITVSNATIGTIIAVDDEV